MSRNLTRTTPRLLQEAKHAAASKVWRAQRVDKLWFDTKSRAPIAAAWSALSFPRFPVWPYTCRMVKRSLCWTFNSDCWQANARCLSASLNRDQANTSSIFGVIINTRVQFLWGTIGCIWIYTLSLSSSANLTGARRVLSLVEQLHTSVLFCIFPYLESEVVCSNLYRIDGVLCPRFLQK